MTDERKIEYFALSELMTRLHPKNAKGHNVGGIIESYQEHGYVELGTIDDRTGLYLAGHGRTQALYMMRKQKMNAPNGIRDDGNDWYVPTNVGYNSKSDAHALAYLAASNKLTIDGGWDEVALADLLQEIANSDEIDISATGFTGDELDELLADLAGDNNKEDDTYSRKIEAPTYEITGDKPSISSLFNNSRTRQLIEEIQSSDLPEDEKQFLIIAAQRHTVLDFGRIAEYYAHSDERTQNLMENSALVIIDFNKAIELGFVQLTESIAGLAGIEYDS